MDIDTAVGIAGESTGGMPATSPLGSTTQMENANGDDWREEVYQKIKSMREMYFSDLNDVFWEIASKELQHPQYQKIDKFKVHKMSLERIGTFLRLNRNDIQLIHKEQLPLFEKRIQFFLRSYKPRKPTSPLQGNNSSISQESSFELHEQQMLQNEYLRQMYQQPLYSQHVMQQQQLFHRQQLMQQQILQSPQSNLTNLQHNSLSGVSKNSLSGISTVSNSPQHMINRVQPGSGFGLGQITMHELVTGCLQQQQSVGRRVGSLYPLLESGISSPQLHGALSPQWTEKVKEEGNAMLPMEFGPYTSAVEDFSGQMGNANEADWQEEVYQKIKSMKEMYLPALLDLLTICENITSAAHQNLPIERIDQLEMILMTMEPLVHFLLLKKHEIKLHHKENLLSVERNIRVFLSGRLPRGQLPQPSIHTSQAQNMYAHQTPTMDSGGQDIASEFDRLLSLID